MYNYFHFSKPAGQGAPMVTQARSYDIDMKAHQNQGKKSSAKAPAKPLPSRKTPVTPKKTSPAPKKTSAAPKMTSPAPKKTSPAPKKTSQAPKETSPAPKKTSPAPKETSPAPLEPKPQRKPRRRNETYADVAKVGE